MTEWTPEEERVANWFSDHWWDGCEVKSGGGRIAACTGPCACREAARDVLAISAMQPRWRDVRTDPPPRDGTEFDVWNGHERVVDVFWSTKRQAWCRSEYEVKHGYVDYTVMPFTHWQLLTPPLPTAPEDKP